MVMRAAADEKNANTAGAVEPGLVSKRKLTPLEVRRRVRAAAAMLVLLGLAAAAAWEMPDQEPGQSQGTEPAKAELRPALGAEPAIETFRRFAVNALVLPLIDDAEPPRWNLQALHWICDGRGQVAVDGQPLIGGAPVPVGEFSVRWNLDRCAPLQGSGVLVDGQITFTVAHTGSEIHGQVVTPAVWVETPATGGRRLVALADTRGTAAAP